VRLGLNLGYWGADPAADADNMELVREADRLGFDSVWVAEAYGADAATVLTWIATATERIGLGSAIFQIPGRSPAMTAMTAASLDMISSGRFRLGLGVSGPQVSEGWHGVRFTSPLGRTRDYVGIVRKALRRERVTSDGAYFPLPLPDGPGKPLKLIAHPVRDRIPVYLAVIGPKNLQLTGEIADGWLAVFYSPEHCGDQHAALRAGREQAGKNGERVGAEPVDVVPTVPMVVGEDIAACADPIRGYAALYVGGMGSREKNFYNAQAQRMGYAGAARTIQDRYLARDHAGAAAAVPVSFLDATSLLGSVERIAERMAAYADSGVTTLSIVPHGDSLDERRRTLRAAVDALERSGAS
jgi:F420-dependent oxidoreductase-like protein